uniref:Uncharacterized protein n=1 Tax=Thermus aquaticus TaxID=271 RepID=Q84FM8_THEAQ|nr:unknown [Thermus aquaticus]
MGHTLHSTARHLVGQAPEDTSLPHVAAHLGHVPGPFGHGEMLGIPHGDPTMGLHRLQPGIYQRLQGPGIPPRGDGDGQMQMRMPAMPTPSDLHRPVPGHAGPKLLHPAMANHPPPDIREDPAERGQGIPPGVLDREHSMGHPVAHRLQALQRLSQNLAPPVAQTGGAHGTGPGGAARGDARRISGDLFSALFGGDYLQVDGDGLTRRQEEGVRIATPGKPPEGIGVGSQKGLTDRAKPVDEEALRVLVVQTGKGFPRGGVKAAGYPLPGGTPRIA